METCRLLGGYLDDRGRLHKDTDIVPLTGREEETLADAREQNKARLVSEVLARCITRLGSLETVTPEITRGLLVADRQYLLLKLRQLTFGPKVQSTVFCPWPDCSSRVDIDFSLTDIPVKHAENRGATYTFSLPPSADTRTGESMRLHYRLPVGADQEALQPRALVNEAEALTHLLDRCLVGEDGGKIAASDLSPAARMALEREMESSAPAVDLNMDAVCPECGRGFSLPFDLQDFFFGELHISRDLLYREVHYLAYHYHWSEEEIMTMPRRKRRSYINVLADEIERMNHEAV